jgi:heat shock 70kDa protein 1/2/6/8
LGGGTFDVSILKIKDGSDFQILAIAGDTHLGGADFDNILVEHCIEKFKAQHNFELKDQALQRLRAECESAKITLSQSKKARICVPCIHNNIDFETVIEKGTFENKCQLLFEKTLDCVRSALADAKLKPTDVDEILLMGGSTRIPKVRELLQKEFKGKNLNSTINPDETVAHGAAIQAAILSGAYCYGFKQIHDVTPFSLGINIFNKDGPNNLMSVIISRNSQIPSKNTERYFTTKDNQTGMSINVYEGEQKLVKDCKLLQIFSLSNITPAPKGVTKADVQFALDENGILIVTATEVGNANTASIRVENISGRLSQDEIDKMKFQYGIYSKFADLTVFSGLRNQMASYITNCLSKLAAVENLEQSLIDEVTKKCALEMKWLESNPNASKAEVQNHLDDIRRFSDEKLKTKTKLADIHKAFNLSLSKF